MATTLVPRLKEQYVNEIRAHLKEVLNKSNIMEVPQITKIVVNMGVGCLLYTSPSPRDS